MSIFFTCPSSNANSQFYYQDTDGLHKALEASILRNEVISELFIYRYKLRLCIRQASSVLLFVYAGFGL